MFLIFNDISGEADAAFDEFREAAEQRMGQDVDPDTYIDQAYEYGFKIYQDMLFVKRQTITISLIGAFHLWERLIKRFIAHEFRLDNFEPKKEITKWNFYDIEEQLQFFKFELSQQAYWPSLNRLRLLANAMKHGPGGSYDKLAAEWPEAFYGCGKTTSSFVTFEYNEPELAEDHFDELVASILIFWKEFPERLVGSKL